MDSNKQYNNWKKSIIAILCVVVISIPMGLTFYEIKTNNMDTETEVYPSTDYEINDYESVRTGNTRSGDDENWSGIWSTKAPMPTARENPAIGVCNNRIYVIGGYGGEEINEEYDPFNDTWSLRAPKPTPGSGFGIGVVNGKVYAIGGDDGTPNEEYDPIENKWSERADFVGGDWVKVAAVNNKIYAFSEGVTGVYNPLNDSWVYKTPMPTNRTCFGVSEVNDKIYVIGGQKGGYLSVVEEYNPYTDTWSQKTSMPTDRSRFAIGAINNKIYVIDGYRGGSINKNEEYNPFTDSWVEKPSSPTPRRGCVGGVLNGVIYILGGCGGEGYINEAYCISPSGAKLDIDHDGLSNLQEFLNGTDPQNSDTDGDSLGDGFELTFSKTDPMIWDTNDNGIGDGLEFVANEGYAGGIQSLTDDWIGMTITWENYTIFIKTNSSVLEGEFEKDERILKIKVSGLEGTSGTTEIDLPKSLCDPEDIEIELDGDLIEYTLTQNETYYHIHIEYMHSIHELTAAFSHTDEEPNGPTGSEEGILANIYLIALIIALVIIILLSTVVIRNKTKGEDIGVSELPPETLLTLLEKRHAEGKITDETYNDARSLLKGYRGD